MLEKYFGPGDKVKIYYNTSDEENIYLSQVEEVKGEEIIVSAPIKMGRILPLSLGNNYNFDFYTSKGIYRTYAEITRRSKDDNLYFIHLHVNKEQLKKIQRRNYFRVDCLIPVTISEYKNMNNEEVVANNISLPEECTVVNISGGGFKFISKNSYDTQATLKVIIELALAEGKHQVFAEGNLVEVEPLYDYTNRFINRVEFENISTKDRDQIIKFVFEQQVKHKGKQGE